MYSDGMIRRLTAYISTLDGINNKDKLKEMVKDEFHLTTDRSIITVTSLLFDSANPKGKECLIQFCHFQPS